MRPMVFSRVPCPCPSLYPRRSVLGCRPSARFSRKMTLMAGPHQVEITWRKKPLRPTGHGPWAG
jgi:hypothetical protein